MKNDLCQRLFEFAVSTIKIMKQLSMTPENKVIQQTNTSPLPSPQRRGCMHLGWQ